MGESWLDLDRSLESRRRLSSEPSFQADQSQVVKDDRAIRLQSRREPHRLNSLAGQSLLPQVVGSGQDLGGRTARNGRSRRARRRDTVAQTRPLPSAPSPARGRAVLPLRAKLAETELPSSLDRDIEGGNIPLCGESARPARPCRAPEPAYVTGSIGATTSAKRGVEFGSSSASAPRYGS
jgi:hypothetical protein